MKKILFSALLGACLLTSCQNMDIPPKNIVTSDDLLSSESGMDIVDALDVMANLMGNKNIERRFRMAIEDVKQGVRLALALDKYKIFPQLLIQMIAVGENTGAMDEVLLKSCDHFDSEVQNALNSATTMIQPIILVIMGGAIGVVFISIYAPILSIMQTL